VSLGATYGYRVLRYLQIEAGVTTALQPTPELGGATFIIEPTDRFVWVPFGLRGVLPLRSGRIDLGGTRRSVRELLLREHPGIYRIAVTGRPGADIFAAGAAG
jgi:hypothetical protein